MPGFELIGDEEKTALNELFDEGGVLFAHGFQNMRKKYHVREFEAAIASRLQANHALAVTSGTAGLKIALKAIGVGAGDEVITQSFNFIATVEAIIDVGAIPIIANVDNSLNMDPDELEALITPKTKAILPVHMLGVPADMDKILAISRKYHLKVIEDNCESLGAKYRDRFLGTLGDLGILSFDFGKVITCGEGGMILTNQSGLDRYAREYHDHGHENNPDLPRGRDTRKIPGFNYRMTEMQGVVGKVQLNKLDTILLENKKRYDILFSKLEGCFQMRDIPEGAVPIYDTFIFFVSEGALRANILALLNREGFGTKNLPDAVEWHCASYWDHVLGPEEIDRIVKTKMRLSTAVAVPIWLKKSIGAYVKLADLLLEI